jgi:hypothetical protein
MSQMFFNQNKSNIFAVRLKKNKNIHKIIINLLKITQND